MSDVHSYKLIFVSNLKALWQDIGGPYYNEEIKRELKGDRGE